MSKQNKLPTIGKNRNGSLQNQNINILGNKSERSNSTRVPMRRKSSNLQNDDLQSAKLSIASNVYNNEYQNDNEQKSNLNYGSY